MVGTKSAVPIPKSLSAVYIIVHQIYIYMNVHWRLGKVAVKIFFVVVNSLKIILLMELFQKQFALSGGVGMGGYK